MNINFLIKKYNEGNLVLKIITGIIIGTILAIFFPAHNFISIFGELFVGALKGIAPILVFILVISSLANASRGQGEKFRIIIFLYLISTFAAGLIAVCAGYLFPQDIVLDSTNNVIQDTPKQIGEIIHNLLVNTISNPIKSLADANYLGILFWAIISGIALKNISSDETKALLCDFSACISRVVIWIINLAPLGILGLVYTAVSNNGIEIFTVYGKLILLLAGSMFFTYFAATPIIVFLMIKKNPYPLLFQCLKESGITAFFTRSSAANIPVNMALCEKLGLDKDMYSVSIPLGATINMNGAAITITIMTLAGVNTLGIEINIVTALILAILATFAACGSSGIAGGSLLLIPMACSLFGISNDIAIQIVGVGFIIGVIQDSLETALNSSSDVVYTYTAEHYLKNKNK